MAETFSKIQVELEGEALLDVLADTLGAFKANIFWETVADLGDKALVNTMHYSLAEM